MFAYRMAPSGADDVVIGTYGFDGKPRSHRLTPHDYAPESWGDVDYWTALRLPHGWSGQKPRCRPMPESIGSVDEAVECFRAAYLLEKPRSWAGRPHQARFLADLAKRFVRLAKPRLNFRGKDKARRALAGVIADEIANDPTGLLGLIPPGDPDNKIRFYIKINSRWRRPDVVAVTRYRSDGSKASCRWYGENSGWQAQPYDWLSMEAAKALGEGFHEIDAPEMKSPLKFKPLDGIVSGDEPEVEVVATDITGKPQPLGWIRPAAAVSHRFAAHWGTVRGEPEVGSKPPVEEAAPPAFTYIDVGASTPDAWAIPAARLTLVGGRLAASTLRVPRGPVEVGACMPPSWGPAEDRRATWPPEVEVGATALDGLGHVARGPPAPRGPPIAL